RSRDGRRRLGNPGFPSWDSIRSGSLMMSQHGKNGEDARLARMDPQGAGWTLAVMLGVALAPVQVQAQQPPPPAAGLTVAPAPAPAGGVAVVGPATEVAAATAPMIVVPPEVQVVRFQGPPGMAVEVLGPLPTPIPTGEQGGLLTVGLQRGVGYRLRIANIPER